MLDCLNARLVIIVVPSRYFGGGEDGPLNFEKDVSHKKDEVLAFLSDKDKSLAINDIYDRHSAMKKVSI